MVESKPTPTVEELLAKATQPSKDAMVLHPFYRGKVEVALKCCVRSLDDFAIWYTPGVAASCRAIEQDPELVYEHTHKWNTVAVVSDGTRVLGLGDIGPKAGLPVMEGKALLYKYLGGVDAWPIMLDTKDPDKIIETVLLIQPGFGGVNLEDISNPKCFRILDTLRAKAEIPIWHDDQQGTATVTLAGLINALKIVGKKIGDVQITFIGSGASNVACARLIFSAGADPAKCRVVDSKGILHKGRHDIELRKAEFIDKWKMCQITNAEGREGGIEEAMVGADVVDRPVETRAGGDQARVGEGDGQGRHRLCLRQPDPRDLAVGGHRGWRRCRRNRPFRLPQPGQQLAGLPRHLPRHARRACPDDHRCHVHGRRH